MDHESAGPAHGRDALHALDSKELRAAAPVGRRPEAHRSRRIEVEFAIRVRDTRFAGTAAGERQLKLGMKSAICVSDYPSSPPPLSRPLFLSALGKDLG